MILIINIQETKNLVTKVIFHNRIHYNMIVTSHTFQTNKEKEKVSS